MASEDRRTERVDIKTGWNCNNRCVFCVQGSKREKFGNKPTEEVKRLLEEARRDSDSIVFTGGEVTIRPDLVELVRFARDLGYSIIQIQTNGRMLAYRKVCEDLIAAGANEFSPALHGPTPELHDYLTCSRAALLVALGGAQFQLAFVHPLGTAGENFYSVVPRLSLCQPYVHRALDVGIAAGRRVMTEAIPYCFMVGYEPYIAERIMPRTKIFEGHLTIADYTEHRLTEGKAKGPPCEECAFRGLCEGPWREYPEHYGWDEFQTRKDLAGAHPATFQTRGSRE